jgi:integrase
MQFDARRSAGVAPSVSTVFNLRSSNMPKQIQFTKKTLLKLLAQSGGKRLDVHDAKQPGLVASLRSGGSLSFYLYRRINGRPARVRLGGFPEITVEQARKAAAAHCGDIARGIDPAEAKRRARGAMTFKQLFAHYLEQHAKPHKLTWQEDQRQFDRYLAAWKNRPLSAIRRTDVQALHAKVGRDNGLYAANRLRSLIHTLFAVAADLGFDGPNPAAGVKKFREQSRQRFLQADELPRFFTALEAEPNQTIRDYFKTLLLVGQRRTNTLEMRWAHVHLDRGTWDIPMTKSGEPTTAYLPAQVIAILTGRKSDAKSEWVFPGHVRGEHLKDPTKNWQAICERAKLENLRPHDLRRTLGSWQAATGASLPIIGKSLGHKSQSATAVYARLNLDPVRQAVDLATAAIMAAAQPQGADNGKT